MAVSFEVERFEWAADDRLELEGRWFGLRGRRFIRPTLDVQVNGEPRRLLALMEHKPWAALDGEEWLAAFAWEGERGDIDAELAVGADLSFELPRPAGARRPAKPAKAAKAAKAATAATAAKAAKAATAAKAQARDDGALAESVSARPARRTRDDGLERKLAAAERARVEIGAEAQALRRALDQKERTVRELQESLDSAREELSAMRDELAAARAAREGGDAELRRELEATVAVRDAALGHAEKAKRERYEAQGALAAAEREATAVARERDQFKAERDELRAAFAAARRERDVTASERDAALTRLEGTRRERDTARLSRDAARAERPQAEAVAEVVRRRGARSLLWLNRERTHDEMLALRFTALVALSVVCLLVAIWILLAA